MNRCKLIESEGIVLRNGREIRGTLVVNLSARGDKDLGVILSREDGEGSPADGDPSTSLGRTRA